MDKTSVRMRLSPEKAAFVDMLSNFTDEQIKAFLGGGNMPPIAVDTPAWLPQIAAEPAYPKPYLNGDPRNVLIVGDLHAPFIREGYLEFCLQQQIEHNCGTVVFIGDCVDQHAISYHESDPDGLSAGQEYKAAMESLRKVFSMFPGTATNPVYSCLGNHDLLVARKAKTAGLSSHFVRSLAEIYKAPDTWNFVDEVELYGVLYRHGGAGGNALRMATHSRQSTVQGHLHSECFVHHLVSSKDRVFGVQCGAGTDDRAYAFAYGRPFPKKSVMACSAVLNSGTLPINLLMPL